MAKYEKAKSEAKFRHNTSIGPNGEILFDAPIEIKDQADLDNYGITWSDCWTLNFHGSLDLPQIVKSFSRFAQNSKIVDSFSKIVKS